MKLTQKHIKEIMVDTHADALRTQDATYYGFIPGSAYIDYTVVKCDGQWLASASSSLARFHSTMDTARDRKTAVARAVQALVKTAPPALRRNIIWD